MTFTAVEMETAMPPQPEQKRSFYATVCAILASMLSIIVGYDIGVMSGAAIFIKDDLKLSNVQLEVLMGILSIYSLLGSAVTGKTSDWIGRRLTIFFAGCLFFLGAAVMGFATNYPFIMAGRLISAIGVGYAIVIAPIYTAEIAPAASRGLLSSFPEIFINVGILLGYVSNYAFAKFPEHRGWRFMLGIAALPSALLALGVLVIPESPRWLVLQGRLPEAMKILEKISDTQQEAILRLEEIKQAVGIPDDMHGNIIELSRNSCHSKGVWRELLVHPTPAVLHILIACLGVHFFQQASGIDAIVLYSPTIFFKAGMKSKHDQLLTTVAVGLVKTFFVIIGTCFVDRFGRRALLLTSMGGMFLSLVMLGSCLSYIEEQQTKKAEWAIQMSVASVMTYVASFSIGAGPVTWVYSAEIFPVRLRAQGASLGVMLNRVVSGVLSMSFLSLSQTITTGGTFQLFALISLVAWFFFYIFLPETRGKCLEEMETLFGRILSKERNGPAGNEIDRW